MSWDVSIYGPVDPPPDAERELEVLPSLGLLTAVSESMQRILPAMAWEELASGADVLARTEADGMHWGEVMRQFMMSKPATVAGLYEDGDLSLEFSFFTADHLFARRTDEVRSIQVAVRGSGDPIVVLRRLAEATGWLMYDGSTLQRLRFEAPDTDRRWKEFQSYVRNAVAREAEDDDEADG